jgi:hypothetical protein
MSQKFLIRQGDVLVASAPKNLNPQTVISRDKGRVVLAYGEVTGHSHAIAERDAELYTLPNTDDRFLRIMGTSGVALVHEEHSTIAIPPGEYLVRIQREYTSADQAPLRVAD